MGPYESLEKMGVDGGRPQRIETNTNGGKRMKMAGKARKMMPRMGSVPKKSTRAYRHIHFAVMAIENAAKRMKIPSWEMYRRLKAQNLIHNRLLSHYDALHIQGIDWVAEDTVETLLNWEAAK